MEINNKLIESIDRIIVNTANKCITYFNMFIEDKKIINLFYAESYGRSAKARFSLMENLGLYKRTIGKYDDLKMKDVEEILEKVNLEFHKIENCTI